MRSARSCFNATLLGKSLMRFWPLWAFYALIWLYALPVRCLMRRGYGADAARWFAEELPRLVPTLGLFLAVVFGLLAAAAVFSYLFNARASGMMHALPIRREGLFLTGYAAGLLGLLVPHVLVWLLTLAAELSVGAVEVRAACVWLAGQSALCLIFYSGAAFCAVLVGHVLALPVCYGVLNGAAAVLVTLIEYLCGKFLYGFVGLGETGRRALLWLTPVAHIAEDVNWAVPGNGKPYLAGAGILAVYGAAALALTAVALLIYRRRHVETAGDVVAVPALRPVFKYGMALCVGLCFGLVLHEVFESGGNAGLAGNLLLWTAIGYFAAEMLLKKSFRVFKGAWKGCLAALLVMGAAIALIGLDVGGFAARVPETAQVKAVTVHAGHTYPYDDGMYLGGVEITEPSLVEKMTQLHRAIADAGEGGGAEGDGEETYLSLTLSYALAGGGTMERRYNAIPVRRGTAVAEAAEAALCDPALSPEAYRLAQVDPETLTAYYVENLVDGAGNAVLTYDSRETEEDQGQWGARLLYEAVRADFETGTLGRRYLFNSDPEREENTYLADLHLQWGGETEEIVDVDGTAHAYQEQYDLTITLTPRAENTLRVLRELGAVKDRQLRLYGQRREQDQEK